MLKKSKKNKAYVICFSFASFVNIASFHQYCELPSAVSHLSFFPIFLLFFVYLSLLFHPFVSSRERHTPRLRRVLSAPCGASNSGTDFFSLAPAPLLRLSRTLLRLSLPFTLFHATAEGLSLPPNAPLRYPPSYLLEALT